MSRLRSWLWGLSALILVGLALFFGLHSYVGGGSDDLSHEGTGPALDSGWQAPPDREATARKASIRGTVLDPASQPAEGALVWAVDARGRFKQTRTNGSGAFEFLSLEPSDYQLAAARGAETSESEGPLPLGAGDDIRDLTLHLAPGAQIAGTVFDQRTHSPLPKATLTVVATPLTTTADERGRFALPPLPSGGHQLSVEAEAHLPRVVPLLARSGEDTRDLEIYLTPVARLAGTVVTQDGTGVPGAALLISRYQPAVPPALTPVGSTDGQGRFALDLPPGTVQLVARTPGFAEAASDMIDLNEGKSAEQKLVVGVGAQVDGLVQTAEGEPLSGGDAVAYRGANGWQVGSAKVAMGGHFTLRNLPAGHLVIGVDSGGARATAEVDVEEAGEATVTLRLGAGVLQGDVVDGAGKPVEAARVTVRPVGAGAAAVTAVTGADGSFKLEGLAGNRFDVDAEKNDSRAELRGIPAGRRDLRLVLATGGIDGTVVGPGSLLVTDFYIAAEPEIPGRGEARAAQVVDGRGEFHLSLSPGRYRLRATAPGYAEGGVSDVEVAAGANTSGVRVELRPAGVITGIVLEDPSGTPLSGIHVGTDRGHAWSVGRESPLGGSAALSGADGRFTLRDVAPGTWPLFASGAGYSQANGPQATVASGENPSPVEVRMRKDDGSGEKPYAGIGMSVFFRGDKKYAGEVFAGGPAFEAGIRSGDEILAVDGQQTAGQSMPEVIGRIRGPQGSEVVLDMRRGQGGEGYSVVVSRAEIRF